MNKIIPLQRCFWNRSQKGSAFLFFVLVMLPLMFFSAFYASDYANYMLSKHTVETVGQSLAMSAISAKSYDYDTNGIPLSVNKAKSSENVCALYEKILQEDNEARKYHLDLSGRALNNCDNAVYISPYFGESTPQYSKIIVSYRLNLTLPFLFKFDCSDACRNKYMVFMSSTCNATALPSSGLVKYCATPIK